jgi:hypothetical protein
MGTVHKLRPARTGELLTVAMIEFEPHTEANQINGATMIAVAKAQATAIGFAASIVQASKPDLVQRVRRMMADESADEALLDMLENAHAAYSGAVELLSIAKARVSIARAAVSIGAA